jgi:protein-ribulosamine 3-kinase
MVSTELAISIGAMIGVTLRPHPRERVHGGSINECYRWETDAGGAVFVKVAPAPKIEMFAAEAAGLEELRRANAVRVPRVLAVGHGNPSGQARAWLALEWIQTGSATRTTEATLGEQLAKQHGVTQTSFGWTRDNTIGSTPQLNSECPDWVTFYRDFRLRYQLDLAARNGFNGGLQDRGAALLDCLPDFFRTHKPIPSLLHGDLWGGNRLTDSAGRPVIFDPAVYYGDREADVAMTHLFGGYGKDFHAAYETAWPRDPGHEVRADLYNLYHVLNHLNLFGGGYLRQATAMIDRLLAAAGH